MTFQSSQAQPGSDLDQTAFLFAAAVLATALRVIYIPQPVPITRAEMDAVALAIARHGAFANPFPVTMETGPTAFVPPLYPLFISIFMRLFGEAHYFTPLAVATGLVYGLHAVLLPRLSQALLGDQRPGLWAGVTCVAAPVLQWIPHWDALYTAAGLMLFTLLALRLRTAGVWPVPCLCGLAAGLLALLNPSSLFVTAPLLLLAGWRNRRRAPVLAMCLGAMLLTVAPWSIRNRLLVHTLSVKDNFGTALYVSNNDCARPSLIGSLDCHGIYHPFGSMAESRAVRDMGEAAYDRSRLAMALDWIGHHRPAFARLTLWRVVQFWCPSTEYGSYAVACWIVTLAGAWGLLLLRRRNPFFFRLCLAVFAGYPLFYYVVISDVRYRYPILWLSLLAYGYALEAIRGRYANHWLRKDSAGSTAAARRAGT